MSLPESVAHYRLVSKLGEGGMGAVYRATDTKLNRDVAVKVLPAAFAADEGRLMRFTREAQVLASLNHPNIATIYGVEERALVMELVEGQPLTGPLPVETVLDYARQMAEALEYAHEKGIVHRDLKPANILVTAGGVVKLLDFGLAKAMGGELVPGTGADSPTLTMGMTEVGVILGTAGYMSPEQARGKTVDRRADIWAFGVILWELLTGKPMFAGENASDVMAEVLTKEPDLMAVPERMRKLLASCLQKDSRQRLKSIGDWRLLAEENRLAPPASAMEKRIWLPWALATILAVCLAAAIWLARGAAGDRPNYHLEVVLPEGTTVLQDSLSHTGAISPSGEKLAFIGETGGTRQIWVRGLETGAARSYPGSELAEGLFWAPDGNRLGFFTGSDLKSLDLATGAVNQITAIPNSSRGGSWGPDGNILFATTSEGITMIPAVGGTPMPVTVFDRNREANQLWPQWLPDGKHFLYFSRTMETAQTGIYMGSLESKVERAERQFVLANPHPAYFAEGYLLFPRGNTFFAQEFDARSGKLGKPAVPVATVSSWRDVVTVSRDGVMAIVPRDRESRTIALLDRSGKLIHTIGEPGQYLEIRLSPDNRSIATVQRAAEFSYLNVWILNVANGIPTRLTGQESLDIHPVWGPNGSELFFASNRVGGYRLSRKSVTSSAPAQLVNQSSPLQLASDVTPDGKYIATFGRGKAATLIPVNGGEGAIPLGGEWVRFSPDGKWAAVMSRETGASEVYVQAVPVAAGENSPKVRVSRAGGLNPAWNADGSELYFHTPARKLMAAKVIASGSHFATREPEELFGLGGSSYYNGATFWEPAGKGDRFVVLRSAPVPPQASRIELLLNWKSGLQLGK